MAERARWDIFCRVVDNYGDAGVCLRLARVLAAEHALDVTLWQDDLATLARIEPDVEPALDVQQIAGVTVRRLAEPLGAVEPADAVIEAFGCGLPDAYVTAMAQREPAPRWFILEYLSAEAWVERSHGLASPHPRSGLARRFWFPGFTARTGGLLRERGLLERRDALLRDHAAQRRWWQSIGVPPPAAGELRVSLFCYPNPALVPLLHAWMDGATMVSCVVPEGVATVALERWAHGKLPHPGAPIVRGRLTVHPIPFLAQDDYDRLLWLSALNFVRGEDSFVRAQWAALPLVWHIYPQQDAAHRVKLDAFLDGYCGSLEDSAAGPLRRFWEAWNGLPEAGSIDSAWLDFAALRPHLVRHARAWTQALTALPELAAGLVSAAGPTYN